MPALQPINGLPLHKMQMAVPPLPPASIGTEPLVLPSGSLLDGLSAALAGTSIFFSHPIRFRRLDSTAVRFDGIDRQFESAGDCLAPESLRTKFQYFRLLYFCHENSSYVVTRTRRTCVPQKNNPQRNSSTGICVTDMLFTCP